MTPEEQRQYDAWFERGKNLGTPGAAELHREIVQSALLLLATAREPFTTVDWSPPA